MKKHKLACAAIGVSLCLAGNAVADDKESISQALNGIQASLSNCDIDKALEFWAADATIFPPVEVRLFKATEDMARWRANCKAGERIKMSLGDMNISVHGDLAVVTALNSGTLTPPEREAQPFTFRFTAVMKKVDGKWKGYHVHVSPPVPEPAGGGE